MSDLAQTRHPSTGAALVTGCSSGIGRASALALAAAGIATYATACDTSTLDELAAAGCHILPLDVTSDHDRRDAVRAVENAHGAVGILVNAAGYGQAGPVELVPLADVRAQFEVNLFGGVLGLAQAALPGMRAAGGGRIIAIGSTAGLMGVPACAAYAASKAALEAYADALRYETRPAGVRVSLIQPGSVSPTNFAAAQIASWPAGTTGGPYGRLKTGHDTALQTMTRPGARGVVSPADVAALVLHAATTPRPRARYRIGSHLMPRLYRALPAPAWDALWRRHLPM